MKIWDATPGFDYNPEIDLPEMHSWFLDGAHSIPPITPMFGWQWAKYCSHGLKTACTDLSMPASKGWEIRIHANQIYCALNIIRDPEEIAAREIKFHQTLQPWLENFDGLWSSYKQELLKMYDKLKELDVDRATNLQLYHHSYDLMQAYMRMWEIHFLGMYASFNAWALLEAAAKKHLGFNDQAAGFQDLVRGFDNKIYQMDKTLWEFKQLAVDAGLTATFKENEPDIIINTLAQSEKGREWLGKFLTYLKTDEVGGWRMTRFSDLTEPYWLEQPAIPIGIIRDNILKDTTYNLDNTRAIISSKREKAIASFLGAINRQGEKDFYRKVLNLSAKISPYNEEHDLYCELIMQALMRRGYLAVGRRLAEYGTIDRPEDVFMMNPEEIERVIMIPEAHDMRWVTRRRETQWQARRDTGTFTFCFTDRKNIQEAIEMDVKPSGDLIAIKAIIGEMPEPKPELHADLWGICGCSGQTEGIARVVFTYDDLNKVESDDILVCPGANPAWTRAFNIVRGVITDTGGTLCHAAIIGREYDLPTIVNTRNATSIIKSGQRVRMDAANGAIYILQ